MPKSRRKVFAPLRKGDMAEVSRWVDDAKDKEFMMIGDVVYAYDKSVVEDVVRLSEVLTVVYSGVVMGQIFKGKLKPEHPLALYVGINRDAVPMVDVSEGDAVDYLRRQDIAASQFDEGVNIVCFKGLPIGFIKRIGARCNNMYPKDLRIMKL